MENDQTYKSGPVILVIFDRNMTINMILGKKNWPRPQASLNDVGTSHMETIVNNARIKQGIDVISNEIKTNHNSRLQKYFQVGDTQEYSLQLYLRF